MSSSWSSLLMQNRAIAVIRAPDFELGLSMARCVAAAGLKIIEITWNSDRPAPLLAKLREELPDCILGSGTIITPDQLIESVSAGAQFIFSPHSDRLLIDQANRLEIPIVPGALTPTEIVQAWQAGASSVKVFPINAMGGASYLRSLRAPLDGIPLIPTGGVTVENSVELLQSGAIAVGLSSELFTAKLVRDRDWKALSDRTTVLMNRLAPYCM
jgi:2-dehydro-3-deoxyphosphogluconate aldolase / (4S)-4-hydroxy-2-oxoglutarate aldolase